MRIKYFCNILKQNEPPAITVFETIVLQNYQCFFSFLFSYFIICKHTSNFFRVWQIITFTKHINSINTNNTIVRECPTELSIRSIETLYLLFCFLSLLINYSYDKLYLNLFALSTYDKSFNIV